MRISVLGSENDAEWIKDFFQKTGLSIEFICEGKIESLNRRVDIYFCDKIKQSEFFLFNQTLFPPVLFYEIDRGKKVIVFECYEGIPILLAKDEKTRNWLADLRKILYRYWLIVHKNLAFFSNRIAHDINNILTVIIGYSDMVSMKIDNDLLKKWIEKIQKGGFRLQNFSANLLVFGRPDLLEKEVFSVKEFIEEYKEKKARKIDFVLSKDFHLSAQKELLKIFLDNLFEFIEYKSEEEKLSIKEVVLDDSYLFFGNVFEKGISFSLELESNNSVFLIDFLPFFQELSAKDLSLSAAIVRRHRGALKIDNSNKVVDFVFPR